MRLVTRRGFGGVAVSAAAAALLAGCTSAPSPPKPASSGASPEQPRESAGSAASGPSSEARALRFFTGGLKGTYYEFGKLLAQHAAKNAGLSIEVLASDGAKENVEAVEDGLADFAFCQADIMTYAYRGENVFEGIPFEGFSVAALLYDEFVQIVTCDSEVRTVADLEGRRVSVGAPNSGVMVNALDILGVYGVSETDITPTYQTFGDSANALADAEIDAAFFVAGIPTASVAELASSEDARIVRIDDRHMKALLQQSPYYLKAAVPVHTYAGQDLAVATVATGAVILAADSVSEGDVYRFVADVFESATDPSVTSSHEKYAELSADKGACVQTVPYHPGAARYFREKGFAVETK